MREAGFPWSDSRFTKAVCHYHDFVEFVMYTAAPAITLSAIKRMCQQRRLIHRKLRYDAYLLSENDEEKLELITFCLLPAFWIKC